MKRHTATNQHETLHITMNKAETCANWRLWQWDRSHSPPRFQYVNSMSKWYYF